MRETEDVNEIIRNLQRGEEIGQKTVFDRNTKTIRQASVFDDPDKVLQVTPEDMTLSCKKGGD